MKITTDIKKSDLMLLNIYYLPKSRAMQITALAITALIMLDVGSRILSGGTEFSIFLMASVIGLLAVVIAVIFGGFILVSAIYTFFAASEQRGILGPHDYELRPEGLWEHTKVNEGLNRWEGIESVGRFGPYALIQISGPMFHVIPKRNFEREQDFSDFVTKATELWTNAQA